MTKERVVLVLLVLCAIAISATAAFFSVYGLSKVFAGASVAVLVMASVLEGTKLITAYALQEYKAVIPPIFRNYLISAVVILMIITSAGIYGFLSNAYQITATKYSVTAAEVSIIQAKMDNLTARMEDYKVEQNAIVKDITELRTGLSSGTRVEYIDKATGQKVSSSSSAVRKSLEAQLTEAMSRRNDIAEKVEETATTIDSMKIQILEMETNDEAAAELGPLIYISKISGLTMDQVVNYFILMIILVFDPLAVVLIVSSSHISSALRKRPLELPTVDSESEKEEKGTPMPPEEKSFVSEPEKEPFDQFIDFIKKKMKTN